MGSIHAQLLLTTELGEERERREKEGMERRGRKRKGKKVRWVENGMGNGREREESTCEEANSSL
jgi:hypothetical protein